MWALNGFMGFVGSYVGSRWLCWVYRVLYGFWWLQGSFGVLGFGVEGRGLGPKIGFRAFWMWGGTGFLGFSVGLGGFMLKLKIRKVPSSSHPNNLKTIDLCR